VSRILTEMQKNRLYRVGWKLWVVQNIIIMIPFIAFIPIISSRIFSYFVRSELENVAARGLNVIFSLALLLDLVSISIISTSTLLYFSHLRKEDNLLSRKNFLLPLSGFLWIIFSCLWRIPLFISGEIDLGFSQTDYWFLEDNQFYTSLLNNPFAFILQIFGAFCFLYFLYSQEKYLETINLETGYTDSVKLGRAFIFGFLNLIGILLMLLGSNIFSARSLEMIETFGRGSNGIFLLLGIMIKIPTLPILALWTSLKFLSLKKLPEISVDKEPGSSILEQLT